MRKAMLIQVKVIYNKAPKALNKVIHCKLKYFFQQVIHYITK